MATKLTKDELATALEELLPPLDPTTVSFGAMQAKLAAHFGVDKEELKTHHKRELKQMITDMIHLCEGGENKENEDDNESDAGEEEDEEEEPVVRKMKPVAKRSRTIHESDDENDDNDDGSDGDEHSEADEDDDSEDEKPKRRKKATAPVKKQKTATTSAAAKRKAPAAKADKPKDSEGIAALKELARVAGLMGPAVYSLLKKAGSEEEQETILRDRLDEGDVRFSGSYPKKSDITAAKKKKDKERELDGIDTSLIISGGRPRRGGSQRPSYVEKYENEDEDEDEELEKGEGQEENEGEDQEEEEDEESEAHVESEASDESEAEF